MKHCKSARIRAIILSVMILILSAAVMGAGCGKSASVDQDPSTQAESAASSAANSEASDETQSTGSGSPLAPATFEYGEPENFIDNEGPLYSFILYPKTGEPKIDKKIKGWVSGVYEDAKTEVKTLAESRPDATGELNIQYNSYLLDNTYAGIEESVLYTTTVMANPEDSYKTFNIDVEKGEFLKNNKIIDLEKSDAVLKSLSDKLIAAYPDEQSLKEHLDPSVLDHIVLTGKGVKFIIGRGQILPTYLGAQQITLTYEELGSAYILPKKDDPTKPEQPGIHTEQSGDAAQSDIDSNKPMVALTFDDGPSKSTERIIELLEEYDGRATFCVLGNRVEQFEDTIKKATEQDCQVIGHSWDHKELTKLTDNAIRTELSDTADAIEQANGIRPTMYRPPYGAVNDKVKSISKDLGFSMINWNIDTLDWKTKNADAIYKAVMKDVSNGSIILCHDIYETTADAMEKVIPELIDKGYRLVTLEELLSYAEEPVEPGKLYFNQ